MAIIERLCQRNGKVNTAWICNKFEISDRQARRDLDYIRTRLIDENFASSVDLVYNRSSNEYTLTGSKDEIDNLFSKSVIASAVAASAVDPLRSLLGISDTSSADSRVRFISQAAELPDYSFFTLILQAIDAGVRVQINYSNIVQQDTVRIIEPLELINYSAIWYVRAYDFIKEKILTFSLSRITKIDILEDKRTFRDYDRLKKEDLSGYGIYSGGKVERYTIRFYGIVSWIVSNQIWHKDQVGRWIDKNTFELSLPASNPTELIAKTLSYGKDAEPIEPKVFVDRYYAKVDELIENVQARRGIKDNSKSK